MSVAAPSPSDALHEEPPRFQHSRWFAPVLTPLLKRRGVSFVLALAGTAQVLATFFHAPAMSCPVMQLFHIPCPGCGASRACVHLLHGEEWQMLRMHAFAPFFLLAIAVFWFAGVGPGFWRNWLLRKTEVIERQTALPTLLLIGVILYWALRLVYAPAHFVHLVAV